MKLLTLLFSIILIFNLPFLHAQNTDPAAQFINSLNSEQLDRALKSFDYQYKENWHYLPGTSWFRTGLRLDALDNNQKAMVYELLRTSLSESGYDKTKRIIDLENILFELEGENGIRNPDYYFIEFFGNPESDSLWAWTFQGHHLAFHFSVVNGKTSIAPRFMGANPAMIPEGPRKGERTLHREEDLGFELINALTEDQREEAIFSEKAYHDVVTVNSIEVGPLTPVGIRYSALNSAQQSILIQLINEYISVMPAEIAEKRLENLKQENLDNIMFGWAGATEPGIGHYYRVQGLSFLIEFDNTQGNANHIHSVWRDFEGDFGRDLIREHYMSSDHH
jgi:hypothetical protein